MLRFLLASLIVGSGVIIGAILCILAKEELKPGRKYFLFLKNILFSAVVLAASFYYFFINPIISLLVLLFLPVLFIKRFQLNLMYIAFAVIYILSTADDQLYLLISSLIFFAGFPIGSLATYDLIRKEIFVERKILVPYIVFVFIALLKTVYQFFY
ncbi:hypothetical protein KY345_01740 [Candidatus Woesearchaeota archaeon]|nr:hypothetical protein [Candidatus Woesearchaeota archaeon]